MDDDDTKTAALLRQRTRVLMGFTRRAWIAGYRAGAVPNSEADAEVAYHNDCAELERKLAAEPLEQEAAELAALRDREQELTADVRRLEGRIIREIRGGLADDLIGSVKAAELAAAAGVDLDGEPADG